MADYLPKIKPGNSIPLVATGTIVGGLMVTTAAAQAGADAPNWLGIASQDAATGQTFVAFCDGVQRPVAAAAISANAGVKCAAAGQVTTWTAGTDAAHLLVGWALEAATGAGVQFAVKFVR